MSAMTGQNAIFGEDAFVNSFYRSGGKGMAPVAGFPRNTGRRRRANIAAGRPHSEERIERATRRIDNAARSRSAFTTGRSCPDVDDRDRW
jgi:hypothetical protein